MANTTNFNWETPDDTDLVKDGAAAIRTLGSAIDTSLVDLKGGTSGQVLSKNSNSDMDFAWVTSDDANAIQNAIIDAKGDLIAGSAADTPARLAVGSNDQVLTADSSTATGLKWATPSAGGITLLSTTTLSGTSVTIGSISQAYQHLQIWIYGVDIDGGPAGVTWEMTGLGSINTYNYINNGNLGAVNNRQDIYVLGNSGDQDGNANSLDMIINIYNYATSQNKNYDAVGKFVDYSTGSDRALWQGGTIKTSTAVSSLDFYLTGGPSFAGGTVKIYGVK